MIDVAQRRLLSLLKVGFKNLKAGFIKKKCIQERQMSTTNEFNEHTKVNFTDR